MSTLTGKVAVVTGGGRGIGKETSILLAQLGATLAVLSNDQEEINNTVTQIISNGGNAKAYFCDLTSRDTIEQTFKQIETDLGHVDILINNAGSMVIKPFLETSIEEWDSIQDLNVRGMYLATRAVVPNMIKQLEGIIINISSIWGLKGGPDRSAYITAKHAVIGFTKALGEEFKPFNIRVNAVCPGPVATKMMEDLAPTVNKDNWLHPIDIAEIIVDLCLEKTKAVTATAIEAFGIGRPVNT
ncbi:SDR family NAD(P)-dependent oxidoreductase [Peribacillus sp. NPDC097225]|uniref:SDR family NAD(P)-dependent oxidoreductase n=1 Tax=Peribacillus sp. NPDC097225 TaxID=3364400 RepID=UPI0037F49CE4